MTDDLLARLRADYCSCHEGYKGRGMTDPQCESCSTKPERNEAADAIERLTAERDALTAKVRKIEVTMRDRQHPATEPRDPPEVIAGLGFWPDCGCGECYAIHCLSGALAERDALRKDAERYRWLRQGSAYDLEAVTGSHGYEKMDAAIDSAMQKPV